MTGPNVLLIGLPADHILVPEEFRGERVRKGLALSKEQMTSGGYSYDELLFAPDDGMGPLEEKLKAKDYVGIIIGFGVRGNIPVTPWFEDIIETIHNVSPKSKIAFNTGPDTCLDAAKRKFPI